MKIVVCVKHVPDTEARIKIAADGKGPDLSGVKMIISPYDEYALEEALRLRESLAASEVVVLAAGGDEVGASLRQALAVGADRAVHVHEPALSAADPLARARALAAALRAEAPDLVFTGKTGVGDDQGQVGPMLAELLDLPHVGGATKVKVDGGRLTAWREIEGAVEIMEGALPALVAWDKGEHEPRYASLKGIMAAKKKPLDVRKASDLGVTDVKPLVVRESMELPPARPAGRILTGDAEAAARELARLLHVEAKVI
jgi:electron transfer flavoprotein beta subunit